MTHFPVSTSSEQYIHAALELSKNSWLLAIQSPERDNPSLHPIRGGDAEGLMAKLDAARDRVAKVTIMSQWISKSTTSKHHDAHSAGSCLRTVGKGMQILEAPKSPQSDVD